MPNIDECCILIPAPTLEDFPSDLTDYDARSLLSGWTVLWHPKLLSATARVPSWYRADAPPEPTETRLVAIPSPSQSQLPSLMQASMESALWLTAASRDQWIARIQETDLDLSAPPRLENGRREIGLSDFYALGYAYLQIQVMTRRLRYTSNLDEVHLQSRTVAAANAYLEQDADTAISALHDVFDLLAQERDHYFSSCDAHLLDLHLVSSTTVDRLLDTRECDPVRRPNAGSHGGDESEPVEILPTPINVLIDGDVAEKLRQSDDPRVRVLADRIRSGVIGWCGGGMSGDGPSGAEFLQTVSIAEAEASLRTAHRLCTDVVGAPPRTYARFTGGFSADLVGSLIRLGYQGLIPLDFAKGSGHRREPKVAIRSAAGSLDALTCQPIDASNEAAFLILGTRLGEEIDSGEVATALFAHWPGETCDSYQDLRRAASWGLSLGRFWKLDDYFAKGDRPYHHSDVAPTHQPTSDLLDASTQRENAISDFAAQLVDHVRTNRDDQLGQLTGLIQRSEPTDRQLGGFARAVLGQHATSEQPNGVLLVNAASAPRRQTIVVDGRVDDSVEHVFAATPFGDQTTVTIDVPAFGFAVVRHTGPNADAVKHSPGLFKRIRPKFMTSEKLGAERERSGVVRLFNEFMEATINHETGALTGVYSGASRGNRFSMRLVLCDHRLLSGDREAVASQMICDSIESEITTSAAVCKVQGKAVSIEGDRLLFDFRMTYTLSRGSRFVRVRGEVLPKAELDGRPWDHYIAARAAVADATPIVRAIVRDKLHRASTRRMVCGLGLLVDESERQTLISATGRPFHRRVGDRFIDSILLAGKQHSGAFEMNYGFDVTHVVGSARALLDETLQIPVHVREGSPATGWLVHVTPKTVHVAQIRIAPTAGGTIALVVQLIQTRAQRCTATVRLLHEVRSAVVVDGNFDEESLLDAGPPQADGGGVAADDESSDVAAIPQPQRLQTEGDSITVPLDSHDVVEFIVFFE